MQFTTLPLSMAFDSYKNGVRDVTSTNQRGDLFGRNRPLGGQPLQAQSMPQIKLWDPHTREKLLITTTANGSLVYTSHIQRRFMGAINS